MIYKAPKSQKESGLMWYSMRRRVLYGLPIAYFLEIQVKKICDYIRFSILRFLKLTFLLLWKL